MTSPLILPEVFGSGTSPANARHAMRLLLTLLPATFIVALVSLPAQGASHSAQEVSIQGCAQNRLAARRGSETCWAQLAWRGTEFDSRLCIQKALWQRMLLTQATRCGVWKGQWKVYSPPLNPLSEISGTPPSKKVLRTFQVSAFQGGASAMLERWVWSIESARERADAWIAPRDHSGVLRELLTGTRPSGGALTLLSLLGFVHLLAAAGIHLYALAGLIHWLLKRVAISWESLPLPWAKRAAATITLAVWLYAWLMGGGRPGMLRPWIVVCLRMGARRLGLRWRRLAPLGLALVVDLAVAIARGELGGASGHGRWVYALACGGGLLARSAPWAAVGSWILAAWLEAAHGGTVALATPILSAVTVPLYAGVLYPLLLLAWSLKCAGFTALGELLGSWCGGISETAVRALTGLAMQDGALWSVGKFALVAGLLISAFLLGTKTRMRIAVLGLVVAIRLGLSEAQAWHPSPAVRVMRAERVWQLDIGQGDAALVRSKFEGGGKNFGLIDVGPERALSDRAWLELLSQGGAQRIDWVALTHLDEDHAGGLKRLALLVRIRCVATARGQLESERGRKFREELLRVGVSVKSWESGCVPYPVLGPPQGRVGKSSRAKANAKANSMMSAVFIPLQGGGFYLSAGDADTRDEPRIGQWAAKLAREGATGEFNRPSAPRILKVSHHGSRTSSAPEFLRVVHPTEAWISSGMGNRYGHPMASVLESLSRHGILVRRTDEEGAITLGAPSIKNEPKTF